MLEYKSRQPSFPHHSTLGDQFFDESQFESYRKLGFHIAHMALASPIRTTACELRSVDRRVWLAELFRNLRDYWHPANTSIDQRRTIHGERYDALLERVMSAPNLGFIDSAFFNPTAATPAEREPLFVGALMLDLMQRVVIDMDLENDRDHPHNAGWIAMFQRWKRERAVEAAWRASSDT